MKIERDKVYVTRCGDKVRVICVDSNCPGYPVVGLDDAGLTIGYTPSGLFDLDYCSACDLVSEYVEPPKPREVWVSVWSNGDYGLVYKTPSAAAAGNPKLVKFREVIA